MTIDTGGPAFPTAAQDNRYETDSNGRNVWNPVRGADTPGMTYRQWLVGLAMQGDLAEGAIPAERLNEFTLWWCKVADAVIRAERKMREAK